MRLGDLDALKDVIERTDWYRLSEAGTMVRGTVSGDNAWYREGDIFKALDEAPTIDAVPVVRCKDCKHTREKNEYEKAYLVEDVLICTSLDVSDDCWSAVWPDHFCSYGERRGDG